MGSRGPKPEPSALKQLKGTGGYGASEPRPRPIVPRCPKYLHPVARREWKRVVPALDRLGLLTEVDGAALEAYCNAYANMVEAQDYLNKNGQYFKTHNGYVTVNPQVAIVNRAMQTIKAFCAEFGLTPSARCRMAVPGVDDEDEMDAFLKGD